MIPDLITKDEAIRRQIRSAIRLFFLREDALAVHTVIGAVDMLLLDVAAHRGVNLGSERLKKSVFKTKAQRDVAWHYERLHRNFLKHANKDPQAVCAFNALINDFAIFTACENFGELYPESDQLVQLFRVWFLLKHFPEVGHLEEFSLAMAELTKRLNGVDDYSGLLKLAEKM